MFYKIRPTGTILYRRNFYSCTGARALAFNRVSFSAYSISVCNLPTTEMEDIIMTKINLRDFYPFYHNDLFVEVPDEVATALA